MDGDKCKGVEGVVGGKEGSRLLVVVGAFPPPRVRMWRKRAGKKSMEVSKMATAV